MSPRAMRAGSFRRAFFCTAPRRYAMALTLDQARRRDQHYDERRRPIIGTMIVRVSNQITDIDTDPTGALAELGRHHRENSISSLPMPPLAAYPRQQVCPKATLTNNEPGITIDRYNQDNDLVVLPERYGARRGRGRRRLPHSRGHEDRQRASLLLWTDRTGKQRCTCLSEYHACPLASQMHVPFGTYSAMERLSAEAALRRLNGKEASK